MLTNGSGIGSTSTILIWMWVVCVAIGVLVVWRSIRRYERRNTPLLIAVSVGIGPALATLALFPPIYALMSIPREQVFVLSFWQGDVSTGTLALRLTSLLLAYQLVRAAVRFVPRRLELVTARKARGLSEDDVADFTVSVTPEERRLWQRSDLVSLSFFQFSLYLVALAALWVCAIAAVQTLLAALASWALLFIVDDWAVIADYCHRFDSLPMTAHSVKVLCINLVLLVAVPIALYQAQPGLIWGAITLSMIVSGLLVVMFLWRARHFGRQDA